MSPTPCPHCGRPFDAAETHRPAGAGVAGVVDLDAVGGGDLAIVPDISARERPVEVGSPGAESGASRRGRLIGTGVIAVALALVAFFVGSRSDEQPAARSDEVADAPASQRGANDGGATGSVDADDASVKAADDVPLPIDEVADLFSAWVDDERAWTVAYPSPMGLQLLSAAGTVQPEIRVAAGFEEAARFPIISDGNRSWAVDPRQQEVAWLVSTQFFVTDIDREGRVAFINDSLDPPNIGESSFGAWGPGFDLPVDAEVFAVPGRGLFVLPATGGTFEYVLNGVEPYSDDRLVGASIDSEVFERCDEQLQCELYARGPALGGTVSVLDVGVATDVWISPGGRWLIASRSEAASGASELLDLVTGERRQIDTTVRAVDWALDGSLAALVTDDRLIVFRSASNEMRSVTLPIAASAPAVLLASG